jgi:hypothetical protein
MKKFLIPIAILGVLAVVMYRATKSPAAEDRVQMDRIAKRTSDSIGKSLDSALNDPIKEMGGTFPYSQPAAVPTATPAANTATAK